jgi:hypothetical protein
MGNTLSNSLCLFLVTSPYMFQLLMFLFFRGIFYLIDVIMELKGKKLNNISDSTVRVFLNPFALVTLLYN